MTNATITLRPVTADDEPFLLEVYASTRVDEMALVPWSSEQKRAFVSAQFKAQQEHYQKTYPSACHQVILSGGHMVGRLYVAKLENEIRILDLTLLPKDRNRGIGSGLLENLKDEAKGLGLPLRIYVETFNPSLNLFRRLGFTPGEQQGMHVLMDVRLESTQLPVKI